MKKKISGACKRMAALLLALASMTTFLGQAFAAGQPERTFQGDANAAAVLNNISFSDVGLLPYDYWAKDAIYEAAALNVIKGYGDMNFGYDRLLTKEQALALAFKLVGRERTPRWRLKNLTV